MRTTVKSLASLVGIALIATVIPAQAATPTVNATVKAQLLYLIEEEKLARDVYLYFATNVSTLNFRLQPA